MNKIIMFFSLIGEGFKSAFVAIFAGSILSTLIVYFWGINEVLEQYEADNLSALIFLSMFFFYFVVPSILPYTVAGVIVEVFKLPTWAVIIVAILAVIWEHYISIRYGFAPTSDYGDVNYYVLFLIRYIPTFSVFLFISLYDRKNNQKIAE